jgi:hypothetical protein
VFGTRAWNHAAFVWVRAATVKFYLNGKFLNTVDISSIGDYAFNADTGSTRLLYSGANEACDMDDIRIAPNVAYSDNDIASVYQDSRRGYPSTLNWHRSQTVFDMGGAAPPASSVNYLTLLGVG